MSGWVDVLFDRLRLPVAAADLATATATPLQDCFDPDECPRDDVDLALERAAAELPLLTDEFQAARLVAICGQLVERGGRAGLIGAATVSWLARAVPNAVEFGRKVGAHEFGIDRLVDNGHADTPGARTWPLLTEALRAALGVAVRDVETREAARSNARLLDALEIVADFPVDAEPLLQLLRGVDRFELVAIHVDYRRGYRLVADCVLNNDQLFTLMQGALTDHPHGLPGAEPDPRQLAFARGESAGAGSGVVYAAWSFTQWNAWDGSSLGEVPEARIWGEESPASIGAFRGTPIVLLGAVSDRRTWSIDSLRPAHPAQRSDVRVVEVLAKDEVERWLRDLIG